ncbi:Nitrogen permease regulator 3 [Cadophora gregata]|uniref:Nitrogen permease regulator 3 n=1 Tax=Cadophora gregata TaxID=51156 RepID=UPI0026DCCD8F|nr:Nitrogen permease regulator 3 [Cadophora gregata]KAK0104770.1 Nitrogen permease regulator 3 [Cadophora gregata]KAK0115149.1 Nitrogen permease regulator 3 [Cadophora gregata f. sp. sojae]
MAYPTAAMESGLIAIALIIRSRDGPRFVFHYPPHPDTKTSKRRGLYGTELDESDSEDDAPQIDNSDLDDGNILAHKAHKLDLSDSAVTEPKDHVESVEEDLDEHYDNPSGEHVVPWEHLFDFHTTDLESILTPSRAYHKKKFELSLDPLYFVSCPMHIRPDGLWNKRKPKKSRKPKVTDTETVVSGKSRSNQSESKDKSGTATPAETISEDGEDHGGMTMFNMVFILNVPKDEADERIATIYDHVIKKLNKALKHGQASANYVWKESEMILLMKEKAREERRPMSWLWSEVLLKSTLAATMRDVFTSISKNKIATFRIGSKPPEDISLQIPVPSFLVSIPSFAERGVPGLLLTTANPYIDEEGVEDPAYINKHFALLLLDDESKIISEIQNDDTELSAPLIECIRICKPTLSFLQVAQAHSIEIGSLLILANHLMQYRRAVAIPPLHPREIYIVSPNCDNRKLPVASIAWKKAFPLAPSLSSFLATLSLVPRPYKIHAPSKDHRPTYLDMLAWLIRGGWVTQLRTFAWILVWPEIIYEVEYQLRAEAVEKAKKGIKSNNGSSESTGSTDDSGPDKGSDVDPSAPLTTEQVAENARLERLASKVAKAAAEDAAEFSKMPKPEATDNPSKNTAEHLKSISPYIIKDPHKVSHEESLYIAALGKRFKEQKVKECWLRFVKYFNGTEALEMIALRENMKRKETWGIVMAYQEHLLVCRHW